MQLELNEVGLLSLPFLGKLSSVLMLLCLMGVQTFMKSVMTLPPPFLLLGFTGMLMQLVVGGAH